jgi:hypothetical protein
LVVVDGGSEKGEEGSVWQWDGGGEKGADDNKRRRRRHQNGGGAYKWMAGVAMHNSWLVDSNVVELPSHLFESHVVSVEFLPNVVHATKPFDDNDNEEEMEEMGEERRRDNWRGEKGTKHKMS